MGDVGKDLFHTTFITNLSIRFITGNFINFGCNGDFYQFMHEVGLQIPTSNTIPYVMRDVLIHNLF